jgi:heptosyltransferase-2
MHMANALRRPWSRFGPTVPAATRPFHEPAVVLHKASICAPCLYRDCPYDHRCMTAIAAGEAAAAAAAYLR